MPTIATIANAESGASVRAKLNSLIGVGNWIQGRPVFACLGDSITAAGNSNSSTLRATGPNGYTAWAQVLSNGRFAIPYDYNKGVIGETTTQIAARVTDITSLSPKPMACLLMFGTNNATGSTTLAQGKTDTLAIVNALQAAGIIPILVAPPPIDDSQAGGTPQNVRDYLNALSGYMRFLSETMPAVYFVDPNRKLITINDGKPISGYLYDGKHPGNYAARLIGEEVAALVNTLLPNRSILRISNNDLQSSNNDRGSLGSNPMVTNNPGTAFSGTNFSGTYPDGWSMFTNFSSNPTVVAAQHTDSEGKTWMQWTFSGTYTSADAVFNMYQNLNGTQYGRISNGDSLKAVCEVQIAKDGANAITNLHAPNLYAQVTWSGGSMAGSALEGAGVINTSEGGWRGILETPVIAVGGTPTGANIYLKIRLANGTGIAASGVIRVRAIDLRKV